MANIATQANANAESTKVTNKKNREMKKFFSDLEAFIKWLNKFLNCVFCKIQNDEWNEYLSVSLICWENDIQTFNDIINYYMYKKEFSAEDQERIAESFKEFFRGIDRTRILDGNYLAFYGRCFYSDEQLRYLDEKETNRKALKESKEMVSIKANIEDSLKRNIKNSELVSPASSQSNDK